MPSVTAQTQKREARQDLSLAVGDWNRYTTSSAGNAGGTTLVVSALSGIGAEYVVGKWVHVRDGTNAGEYRRCPEFSGTTISVANAYTGQVATSIGIELHTYRPDLYTQAVNRAIQRLYPSVYRLINSHIIPHTHRASDSGDYYSMPRDMRDVFQISRVGQKIIEDHFDRADSTTTPGNSWLVQSGTWGIISERLYSVSDANGNLVNWDTDLKDGIIQAPVRGTLNSATNYRSPALIFRLAEDRNQAIDVNNYLVVRMLAAVVDLRKVDAGTESSLATATATTADGTDYVLRIQYIGRNIKIWVDDQLLIDYNLLGQNLKYLEYPRVGVRWDVGGSPATAARVDDFWAFSTTPSSIWPDWELAGDRATLHLPAFGSTRPSGILLVEGREMLTLLTDDTTTGALDTDTTERIEILNTDPAYRTFIEQAKAELYKMLASEIYPEGIPTNAAQYAQLAALAEANVATMPKMSAPPAGARYAVF